MAWRRITRSSLAVAGHSITAQYKGETNFTGSTSTAFTQTVGQAGTTTGVTTSVDPSAWGQSVTFTATVSVVSPGSGTPTGTVTFYDGTTAIDSEILYDGTAAYTTSALAVSGHSITAQYLPSADFAGSTSTAFTQTVDQDGSATSLGASSNPAVLGQPVTFTATVTAAAPGSGTPTGSVTFYDGTTAIDTETLAGGMARFTTSALALGGHAISAVLRQRSRFHRQHIDDDHRDDQAGEPVGPVTSSVNPTAYGQSVTFTATVSATPPGNGHADRSGHVLRRHDGYRHRDPERRHGFLYHIKPWPLAATRLRFSTAATPFSSAARLGQSHRRSIRTAARRR